MDNDVGDTEPGGHTRRSPSFWNSWEAFSRRPCCTAATTTEEGGASVAWHVVRCLLTQETRVQMAWMSDGQYVPGRTSMRKMEVSSRATARWGLADTARHIIHAAAECVPVQHAAGGGGALAAAAGFVPSRLLLDIGGLQRIVNFGILRRGKQYLPGPAAGRGKQYLPGPAAGWKEASRRLKKRSRRSCMVETKPSTSSCRTC